jgi:hypothetical protein
MRSMSGKIFLHFRARKVDREKIYRHGTHFISSCNLENLGARDIEISSLPVASYAASVAVARHYNVFVAVGTKL